MQTGEKGRQSSFGGSWRSGQRFPPGSHDQGARPADGCGWHTRTRNVILREEMCGEREDWRSKAGWEGGRGLGGPGGSTVWLGGTTDAVTSSFLSSPWGQRTPGGPG